MGNVRVYYLTLKKNVPSKGYWDYAFLDDLLCDFDSEEVNTLPESPFAVVVIPARGHAGLEDKIVAELQKINQKIVFLMGDEENSFKAEKLSVLNNLILYIQNPKPDLKLSIPYRNLGCGYTPHVQNYPTDKAPLKEYDYFFSGQITHRRREEMAQALRDRNGGRYIETKGFTAGLPCEEYVSELASAKVAPCPSGPETPDTFRLFEALELGCVPIADTETPKQKYPDFWEFLFESEVPFTKISDYKSLPGYISDLTSKYPALNNRVQAWWIRYKQHLKKTIRDDITKLGGELERNHITAIIPISPIKSHPDTKIIDETIASIWHHIPNAQIILTFDGVREEQEDMRTNYEEHIRQVLWKYRKKAIIPYVFNTHIHQVGMMREIIESIDTPLVLYMEHDCPLVSDYPIDWPYVQTAIESGKSNLIRFHFEAFIPKPHLSLMLERDQDLMETVQYSQRPHLASTAFYRRILRDCFSSNAKCFIEDVLHGKVMNDYNQYGRAGWQQWRLHIYHPDGVIKRSYTTDGRAGNIKFDSDQIW